MLIEKDCDIVKPGYALKNKDGDIHLVLDVIENDYVQNPWGGTFSFQSRNEPKERIFRIWDGKYLNNRSQSECEKTYSEVIIPSRNQSLGKVLRLIASNWKSNI